MLRLLLSALLLATLPFGAARAEGPKKKKSKPKPVKKAKPSKYKFTELSEGTEHAYRFDEKGEPIVSGKKKKPAAKKKASSEPAEEEPAACSEEQPCAPRSSEADAL